MICNWCEKREVEFELVIYHLRKEMTHSVPETIRPPVEQLLRNGTYLKVHLCEKCLPCTATKNPLRTKLRGHEIKQSQNDKK